jgi:hypothetical protein
MSANIPTFIPVQPSVPVEQPLPAVPVVPQVPPVDDDECPPEPCVPHEFDMTLEIKPNVKLCIGKPNVTVKNHAVCICTPCNPPQPPV